MREGEGPEPADDFLNEERVWVFGSRKRDPGMEIGKLTTAGLNGEKMIKLGSLGLCQRVKAMEEKSAASKYMGMEAA